MEKYFDIYDVDGKRGRYIDSSIFSFIRNSTTGGFETRSEDSLYSIDEDDPTHIVYAKRIGASVRALKREYHAAEKAGRGEEFVTRIVNRNLITEEQY